MPLLRRGEVDINYDVHGVAGNRPPLLLSHGFSASGRMWDRNGDALGADRLVLSWDMRGHGLSDSPPNAIDYGVQQSVEDMLGLLELLDLPRAVLGGMSLGGYLSLAFH